MSDIFKEVEEDLRREQSLELWKKYGKYVLALAVVIVATAAGIVSWKEYRERAMNEQGAEYASAMALIGEEDQQRVADAFGALASHADGGYQALARLQEAAALIAAEDDQAAFAVYDQLIDEAGTPDNLRRVARYLRGMHQIGKLPASDIRASLAPLMEGNDPWRFLAQELVAMAELDGGNLDGARQIFRELSDDAAAPAGVRARAARLLQAIGGNG
ncbi:tetratricopeptide repeat protein [Oceanibacterium hippocampi]|uniref:Ancillary SecYEG translocon subunit/Cell division coordinator CpoB TPR domain-containing protein n=1 Tax=Oceanibacterium hippocampi TaxID=745714 RepID=A0A1Y5ST83_9PROT|nr:tetratricopeptide repeat protein [Oceanibacterium hippocampi]SLN47796.1 hypothetical protein OCH7691_02065 [Oceanibacterium hippocampi]